MSSMFPSYMTNVNKSVSCHTEAASPQTVRRNGRIDERKKSDRRSDGDTTAKEGSKEKTTVGSEQGQCIAETYLC